MATEESLLTDDGADDEDEVREETPTPDRRMTLIPERAAPAVKQLAKEPPQKKIQNEVLKQIPSITKSAPTPKQVSLDNEPAEPDDEDVEEDAPSADDKELYSDEEIEETFVAKKDTPKPTQPVEEDVPEADEDDDVEIIEEEELEEQIEEELEEEEISDVDDAELLSRLEAKYGRLPEPERPGQKFKDGGNSVDEGRWPGEPADAYWRQQLDSAEQELGQDWLE